MPLIFQTKKDHPYDVEIGGVGTLGASARGGIPVERAAERVRELQDDGGKPLTGKALEDAAKAFTENRFLQVTSRKTIDEEALRVAGGAFPTGLSIEEISRSAAERDFGFVEATQANPDAAVLTKDDVPLQETEINPAPATPPNA